MREYMLTVFNLLTIDHFKEENEKNVYIFYCKKLAET